MKNNRKMSVKMQEIRDFKKARKKKNYSPGEDYPNVEEAKELLKKHYKNRGFKVKKVENRWNGFLVKFGESSEVWNYDGKSKGLGPYGIEQIKISWESVRNIKNKNKKT